MKKLLMILLALALVMSMVACAEQPKDEADDKEANSNVTDPKEDPTTVSTTVPTEPPTTVPTEPPIVMANDTVTVDGIYVDSSYEDADGAPLKMVYLFLTVNANEKNLSVDSKYMDMNIGANNYESDFYKGACAFMPSYYYSSFIEDVYVGTTIKLALTFKVPEGDLVGGKEITLEDSALPLSDLRFTTDEMVTCNSVEQIAELADPEGWADIKEKREPADDATAKKVRNAMNGYYWSFYVSAGTSLMQYELEFYSPNKFELRTPLLTNSGTYEVCKGYIILTYNSNGGKVEIPYEWANGDVSLYCSDAFSIYE